MFNKLDEAAMSLINSIIETQEFATLPPVASKLLRMLENDEVDIRDVSQVIETDAALTLKLLRVANSPIFATRTEINSIQQAIVILGLNRLTNIVLGVSIFSRFLMSSQKHVADIMKKFWWHSSCTGIVAKALTTKTNLFFKENEFIGGLLHDIGKLAMLQYDVPKYEKLITLIKEKGISDSEAEKEIYGIDHLEVGAQIAKLWKLPEELSTIISNHNTPALLESNKELVAVVRIADLLCEMWGADIDEGCREVNIANEECWQILCSSYPELTDMDMESFTFDLEEQFKKSTIFLNIMLQNSN